MEEVVKSSSEVEIIKNVAEEVDIPPIDVQYPPLTLSPASVPTVEWWVPQNAWNINDGLSRLRKGKTKKTYTSRGI